MENFVVISGCSGGGKSTLLAELGRRGHMIVEEPGRRIVQQELQGDGSALPWRDADAFIRRAMAMAFADRAALAAHAGRVFFDRGLIDAAAGLERIAGFSSLRPGPKSTSPTQNAATAWPKPRPNTPICCRSIPRSATS